MRKLCLVTGGSRGIGKDIVRSLFNDGYDVAFTYNQNHTISKDFEKICFKSKNKIKSYKLSLSENKSFETILKKIQNDFSSKITILINNAAISQEKSFENLNIYDINTMFNCNLFSPMILSQLILPNMIRMKWGRIINISSIGGQWGGYNQVHYASSKAGLINFSQSLARLYSNKGITANNVAIGLVKTDMSANEISSELGKKKIKNIPIERLGTVQDISNTVLFLCSDKSSYITGQTINLNGGMYFG